MELKLYLIAHCLLLFKLADSLPYSGDLSRQEKYLAKGEDDLSDPYYAEHLNFIPRERKTTKKFLKENNEKKAAYNEWKLQNMKDIEMKTERGQRHKRTSYGISYNPSSKLNKDTMNLSTGGYQAWSSYNQQGNHHQQGHSYSQDHSIDRGYSSRLHAFDNPQQPQYSPYGSSYGTLWNQGGGGINQEPTSNYGINQNGHSGLGTANSYHGQSEDSIYEYSQKEIQAMDEMEQYIEQELTKYYGNTGGGQHPTYGNNFQHTPINSYSGRPQLQLPNSGQYYPGQIDASPSLRDPQLQKPERNIFNEEIEDVQQPIGQTKEDIPHPSYSGMGQDVIDQKDDQDYREAGQFNEDINLGQEHTGQHQGGILLDKRNEEVGQFHEDDLGQVQEDIGQYNLGQVQEDIGQHNLGQVQEDIGQYNLGQEQEDLGQVQEDIGQYNLGQVQEDVGQYNLGQVQEDIGQYNLGQVQEDIDQYNLGQVQEGTGKYNLGQVQENIGQVQEDIGQYNLGQVQEDIGQYNLGQVQEDIGQIHEEVGQYNAGQEDIGKYNKRHEDKEKGEHNLGQEREDIGLDNVGQEQEDIGQHTLEQVHEDIGQYNLQQGKIKRQYQDEESISQQHEEIGQINEGVGIGQYEEASLGQEHLDIGQIHENIDFGQSNSSQHYIEAAESQNEDIGQVVENSNEEQIIENQEQLHEVPAGQIYDITISNDQMNGMNNFNDKTWKSNTHQYARNSQSRMYGSKYTQSYGKRVEQQEDIAKPVEEEIIAPHRVEEVGWEEKKAGRYKLIEQFLDELEKDIKVNTPRETDDKSKRQRAKTSVYSSTPTDKYVEKYHQRSSYQENRLSRVVREEATTQKYSEDMFSDEDEKPSFWSNVGKKIKSTYDSAKEKTKELYDDVKEKISN